MNKPGGKTDKEHLIGKEAADTLTAAPWEIPHAQPGPSSMNSESKRETRGRESVTEANHAPILANRSGLGLVNMVVFSVVFICVLSIGLTVKLVQHTSPAKVAMTEPRKELDTGVSKESSKVLDSIQTLEHDDELADSIPSPIGSVKQSLRETKLPSDREIAKLGEPMVPNEEPVLPKFQTVPYRLDFEQYRSGELPTDWLSHGGIGIDWQQGIPRLGRRNSGVDLAELKLPATAGGDFFWEVQLTGETYGSITFSWSSRAAGQTLPVLCEATRNNGWQLEYLGQRSQGLRDLYYSSSRGTWFYLENRVSGDRPGLYVWVDGIPSTRQRIGDPMTGIYDAIVIVFDSQHSVEIQNLRWGPLENNEDVEKQNNLTFDRITLNPLAESSRWTSLLPNSNAGVPLSVMMLCERNGVLGAQFNLIGRGSTPTLSFMLDFNRAGVLNAPFPGSRTLTNQVQGSYRDGKQQLTFTFFPEQVSVNFNQRHLYKVPVSNDAEFSSIEVDIFGQRIELENK